MEIRKALTKDGIQIHALINKYARQEQMLPRTLLSIYENIRDFYVAVEGDVVRGSVRVVVRNGVAVIMQLSVDPNQAGRGIGTALLDAVEERARGEAHKLYLEVPMLTPQTLRFFIDEGYDPAGILRRHYGGVDWIAFERFLS